MNTGFAAEILETGVLTYDEELLYEQLRVYFARARTAVLSAPVAWVLLAYIQYPQAGWALILAWILPLAVVDGLTLYHVSVFERHPPRPDDYRNWRYRQHMLHGLAGLCWGMAAWFLAGRGDLPGELLTCLFLVGVSANCVTAMCAFRTGVAVFTTATWLPVAVLFIVRGDFLHLQLLAGLVALLGIENLYAWVANRQLVDGIAQAVSNRRLSEALLMARDSLHRANRELEDKNSALVAMSNRLREQAEHDDLTGAFNRRHFYSQLDCEMAVCSRHRVPATLIMIDIDHFKQINDRFGHLAGDAVLRNVVEVVQSTLRESDVFARFGGEEFMVLLRMTARDEAVQLAERLLRAVRMQRCSALPDDEIVTISIGVAAYQPGEAGDAWIERADSALYQAKAGGRDRVSVYGQLSLPIASEAMPAANSATALAERHPAFRIVGGTAAL